MDQRKKLYLEIGLAVVLVIAVGVFGARIKGNNERKQGVLAMAELENQAAAQKIAEYRKNSEEEPDAEDEEKSDEKSETKNKENDEKKADTEEEIWNQYPNGADVEEVIADGQYPIMGNSTVTVDQMVAYFEASGYVYPAKALAKGGADSIETFCQMYFDESVMEGVRPEVAFAQTMKETGFLQYGGDASIEQFNFAGLGTTGGGVPGNSYPDVRTGIRAQVQHLKAYASTDSLTQACVDDRYQYVLRGCAPYVEWLGQQENPEGQGWATAERYGYSIVDMIHKMKEQ